MKPTKKFVTCYHHDGSWWTLMIDAYDQNDAQVRCLKLGLQYDGEHIMTIPAYPGVGILGNAICAIRNFFWRSSCLLVLLLCSCELPSEYYASSGPAGNVVREKRWGQLGGTRSSSRSDGSSEVNNYENSLRDGANAAVTIAGGISLSSARKSDNAFKTTQVLSDAKSKDLAAKLAAEQAALDARLLAEKEAREFIPPIPPP